MWGLITYSDLFQEEENVVLQINLHYTQAVKYKIDETSWFELTFFKVYAFAVTTLLLITIFDSISLLVIFVRNFIFIILFSGYKSERTPKGLGLTSH